MLWSVFPKQDTFLTGSKSPKYTTPNGTDFPAQHPVSGKFEPSLSWDRNTDLCSWSERPFTETSQERQDAKSQQSPSGGLDLQANRGAPVTLNLTPPPPSSCRQTGSGIEEGSQSLEHSQGITPFTKDKRGQKGRREKTPPLFAASLVPHKRCSWNYQLV